MGDSLYICNKEGDIFEYVPSHTEDSEELTVPARTNFMFTSFHGVDDNVSAFACGTHVSLYPPQIVQNPTDPFGDELESSDNPEKDKVFYVARYIESKQQTILSVYSKDGELFNEYMLPISEQFHGMEVWPKDGDTVVATSLTNIYVIDLSTNPPSIVFSEASSELAGGIAYKSGYGFSADFWVGVSGEYSRISIMTIEKISASNQISFVSSFKISSNSAGFANYQGKLHWGYKNDKETTECKTFVKNYENNDELIIPVSGVEIASPVAACAYLPPYEEQYFSVKTLEYDNLTGELKDQQEPSTFGAIAAGTVSETKVLRLNVPWTNKIKNVKLGILDAKVAGDFDPNLIRFGTSQYFIPSYEPTEVFSGMNLSDSHYDINNKSIPSHPIRNVENLSDYVYLSIEIPNKYFGAEQFQFKWYFDFEEQKEAAIFIPVKNCPEFSYDYSSKSSSELSSSRSTHSSLSSLSNESSDFSSPGCHPCELHVAFMTYIVPDALYIYINGEKIFDSGFISTGNSFVDFYFTINSCDDVQVCVDAPVAGTAFVIHIDGCGMSKDFSGGQGYYCWEGDSEECFDSYSSSLGTTGESSKGNTSDGPQTTDSPWPTEPLWTATSRSGRNTFRKYSPVFFIVDKE